MFSTKTILLCMIGLRDGDCDGGLGGITRLQKFVFLLDKEQNVRASGDGFAFEPYKAGPYSHKLYDDIEFLENLGYIESDVVGEAIQAEMVEIDALNFDELFDLDGRQGQAEGPPDSYGERRFRLTSKGRKKVKELLKDPKHKPNLDAIRKIKSTYGGHSLSDLLYHVYVNYPEMTTESEIKDKIIPRWQA